MNCKNCGNSINENFCSYCGQRTSVSVINFSTIKDEFQDNIFQINRGFLFTIKELTVRPGHAIRDFINGKRKPFYKPLSFLLVTTTIYIFTAYILDIESFLANFLNSMLEGWNSAGSENEVALQSDEGIIGWLKTNQTYLVFCLVPIYALSSFIIFIKNKYNYYEHLVLQIYITGQQFLIASVLTCILLFYKDLAGEVVAIVSICYSLFVYYQFFKEKKFISIGFRYTLIQVLFFILYFIISFVVILISFVISKLL